MTSDTYQGVPVIPWSKDHGTLRTRTQAKHERIVIPPDAKPVAALKGYRAHQYFFLYDVSECEVRPLTEKDRERNARREATIAERYGCSRCTTRYLKEDQRFMLGGICFDCRVALKRWNDLLEQARLCVAQETPILIVEAEPSLDMASFLLSYQGKMGVTCYRVYSLLDGALSSVHDLSEREGFARLAGLLQMVAPQGVEVPLFVCPSGADGDLLCRRMGGEGFPVLWEWQRLFAHIPLQMHQSIPLKPKGWQSLPGVILDRERYYAELCTLFGLSEEGTLAEKLSRVIQHLAALPLENVPSAI